MHARVTSALHCLEIRKGKSEEGNKRSRREVGTWARKINVSPMLSRFLTPIFLELFSLTFLAEWGDRSQIATVALATQENAVAVAVGACIGHTICSSIAVVGGSMLALKISQGKIAVVGSLLFLGFSLSSYFYPRGNEKTFLYI